MGDNLVLIIHFTTSLIFGVFVLERLVVTTLIVIMRVLPILKVPEMHRFRVFRSSGASTL